MQLEIVTPHSHNKYEAAWIEINTSQGNYIIQQGHVPMIVSLSHNQPITFRLKSGKQQTMQVFYGMAHVTRELVTIILGIEH